jgi:hypothetical protein
VKEKIYGGSSKFKKSKNSSAYLQKITEGVLKQQEPHKITFLKLK